MRRNLLILFLLLTGFSFAQQPFSVSVVQSPITTVPAIHSCAYAAWNGKWIFIGGRRDGLHNFQAGMGFSKYTRNDSVYVVDPVTNTQWVSGLTSLPDYVREAISSSNAEFFQADSMLYLVGGYGRCDSMLANITFPTLSAINLSTLVDEVVNGYAVAPAIRQLRDSNIIVTGGHLQKIDSTYYLIFGHRFDGMYSKISGSTLFTQTYSNSIRKFNINDDGTSLAITNYTAVTDTDNFHRRDLNVAEQIFPNGDFGYTAFGGVFQKTATLPFLTPIDITATNIQHQSGFNQNLNQYETAAMPVYDSLNNFMHTIFFGGMSLYTLDTVNHVLMQDTLVPFVNTISKVSRDGIGNLSEFKLPVEMPLLTGTDSRFIPDSNIFIRHKEIVDLNSLSGNTRVGWIVSGILSDFPNIADLDPEGMSRPSSAVYEVWIDVTPDGVKDLPLSNTILGLNVYPNPVSHTAYVDFILNEAGQSSVDIFNAMGLLVKHFSFTGKKSELVHIPVSTSSFAAGLYTCIIKTEHGSKEAKFVVQ
ncbi:MAG: T9SS type A sorting domain-containing protein [Bacteroidota bacterium]